jgi:hypothetical protein
LSRNGPKSIYNNYNLKYTSYLVNCSREQLLDIENRDPTLSPLDNYKITIIRAVNLIFLFTTKKVTNLGTNSV